MSAPVDSVTPAIMGSAPWHPVDDRSASPTFRRTPPKLKALNAGQYQTIPTSMLLAHRLVSPSPVFPEEARLGKQDGAVVIAVEVGMDGKVVQTLPLSGRPILTGAAEEALKAWVFQPFVAKGKPQVVRSAIQFDYRWRGR